MSTKVNRVVQAIQKLYPKSLADSSWDNTGLLVDAISGTAPTKVLLTIDLTQSVAQEAIDGKCSVIMAYHPFIFKGLKSITQADPQQRSLIRLIQNNIAVYCPHTAVDAQVGGVNDFLCDGLQLDEAKREPLEVSKAAEATEGAGMGRLMTLAQPTKLSSIVDKVKESLNIDHVQVAVPHDQGRDQEIRTIAVCAGSGGGVFRGIDADLYYTGEISHHEALYFAESGSSVIACNHSNTERAFLKVFKEQLQKELGSDAEIVLAETDRDPLQVW
ncbi:hypothetical protein DICA0_F15522 [Diutina catenulata]